MERLNPLYILGVPPYVGSRKSYFKRNPIAFGTITEEISYSVIIAGALHLVWGYFSYKLGYPVSIEAAFLCLINQINSVDKSHLNNAFQAIINHPIHIFLYFATINISAGILGRISNWSVRRLYFDLKYTFFRNTRNTRKDFYE